MSRITIIAEDGVLGIGGKFHAIDVSDLPANIHAVQWDENAGVGEIEYKDGTPNEMITDIDAFSVHVDRWTAADTPPPPTLAGTKEQKKREISGATNSAITSGFESSALGSPHTYDSDSEWQRNITAARLVGIDMDYTCTDANGVKDGRFHTAAQIAQVFADGVVRKQTLLAHFRTLVAQVAAATTIAEVEAIVWSDPANV